MTKEKAEKITRIYNWVRIIIVVTFLAFLVCWFEFEEPQNLTTSRPHNLITS